MCWRIIESSTYRGWWDELSPEQQDEIAGRLELLRQSGPALGRPIVDRIRGSKIHNLKELRAKHKTSVLRVLFVFDPDRQAVLLVGGDKAGGDSEPAQWAKWYESAIQTAEEVYEAHLEQREQQDEDTD